jgi:hypothetical protein
MLTEMSLVSLQPTAGATLEALSTQRRAAQEKVRELLLTADGILGSRLQSEEYATVREAEPLQFLVTTGEVVAVVGVGAVGIGDMRGVSTPERGCCVPEHS